MNPIDAQEERLNRLAATLDEYLKAVPLQQQADPPDLLLIFSRLEAIEAELGADDPPQLRHYLRQKSYRKAFLFLQGHDPESSHGPGKA